MEHTGAKEVAARVAATITRQGVTQRSVAEATQIPLTTFNRKLSGRVPFNVTELFLIADALSVSAVELFPERRAA
jgi:transcriptional regulator with XRE-family HTH domain